VGGGGELGVRTGGRDRLPVRLPRAKTVFAEINIDHESTSPSKRLFNLDFIPTWQVPGLKGKTKKRTWIN